MSEITKEQIGEILHKNTLIVGENIPNELVEQIANNVEHMSEQDKKYSTVQYISCINKCSSASHDRNNEKYTL